mgnify:CR=1 FL=1
MIKTADVIVIGSGIVGSATAYELAKRGKSVLVLEKYPNVGDGASSRNGAGVRLAGRVSPEAELAAMAIYDIWPTLGEELDADLEYVVGGSLTMAHSESQMKSLQVKLAKDLKANVPSRIVDGNEAREICPILSDYVEQALYSEMDGHANPMVTTLAYYRAARRLGVDYITGENVIALEKMHGCCYSVIPDQIEAGTFMFAAAATRGDVTVLNVIPKHLDATISKLVDIGCEVEEFDDAVRVVAKRRLKSTQVKTLPYPGYPTDMQPQIGVVLALAKGTSTITESIFENRFKYLDELARMGANIKVEGNSATIEGVEKFTAARVSAPDLRAGAALCIAGLATEGITIVDDIVYIQRGYERFEEKLRSLGGIIEKVSSEKEIQKFKLKVG